MSFSRRELFHNAGFGLLLLPALMRSPRTILGHLLFDPDGPLVPLKPIPDNPFRRHGRSVVSIVYGKDPRRMLPRAIDLLGAFERELGQRLDKIRSEPALLPMGREAHALKSAALAFGAAPLGKLAKLLESDCRQQQEIAAREHAAALLSTGAQVQAAIRHWLDVRVGVQP